MLVKPSGHSIDLACYPMRLAGKNTPSICAKDMTELPFIAAINHVFGKSEPVPQTGLANCFYFSQFNAQTTAEKAALW